MSSETRTIEDIKSMFTKVTNQDSRQNMDGYNSWAENYDQDVAALGYCAPRLAAEFVAKRLGCNREDMEVLDVACGTGLVAKEMKSLGFERFVGIDGSEGMLEKARELGLYRRLQRVFLGEEPIPADLDSSFDVVMVIGALGGNQLGMSAIREIYKLAKQSGFICLTLRADDNPHFRVLMEQELRQMEAEGLWRCVEAVETNMRRVEDSEGGEYVSYGLFLYERM